MPPRKRKAAAVEAPEAETAPAEPQAKRPARGKRAAAAPAAAAPAAARRKGAAAAPGVAKEDAAKLRRIVKEFHVPLEGGYCFSFGTNPFGALGLGEDVTEKPRAALVDIRAADGGRAEIVQVAAGGMHTAALDRAGAVYTWGVNDEGALGRPTAGSAWEAEPESGKEDPALPGPARLPPGARAVQVAAGDGFTFALADDGSIWGWGCFKDDGSGAAGFPGAPAGAKLQRLPARVYEAADVRDRVLKLAAGARHMAALTRRGDVLTWGMGGQGQLGRVAPFNNESFPPLKALLAPAPVPGVAPALGSGAADVACGAYSTFAIGARGAVAAWGLNNAGQLALPLAAGAAGTQQQQNGGGGGGAAAAQQQQPEGQGHFHWEPKPVPALARVAAIAGGEHHTLALTRKGEVLSFGAPTYGMLGRSNVDAGASSSDKQGPFPIDAADGLGEEAVFGVAAGTNVSAAVTRQGNLFLWGSNVNLQMAKGGDEDDNALPARMRRHKAFGQRRVMAAAFGGQHGVLLASEEEAPASA
ncbi:MAG: regulator of chromosome condensation 1/beta-lactamase-inhibitor protein II [Monoraphidium minutum]|nr:MAG: regulator of chromosome condensation 1/beta-lactamase-inhibitor protein II [Monoraphidium minutum]